jgi:serine/threonine-protein kinase
MPLVGDVLADRYRVTGPLGAGGMASVWRARDLRLGRDVAVKILLPNLSADPATATRFDREARNLAAAAHPNVVAVYDVEPGDPAQGREPFYVMELCEGGSLADRLRVNGRLPPEEVARVVGAVAAGLAELHRRGMVHRDIKPHNILFDGQETGGQPKLADFGLAQTKGDGLDALTATGTTIGTLAYLAPELLAGATATAASDVYGLGVVAFQALTGRLPRPAANVTEVVEGRAAPATLVSAAAPELGTAFDAALAPALAPDPAARPTPTALAAALDDAVAKARDAADQPTTAVAIPVPTFVPPEPRQRDEPPRERDEPPRRSRPALKAITGAALVIAALLAASTLLGDRHGGPGASPSPRGAAATEPAAATPDPTEILLPSTPAPAEPTPPPAEPTPPAVDPGAQPGLAALPEVLTRIADARAAGLEEPAVARLERLAGEVEQALRSGDLRQARQRAEQLVEQTDKVEDGLEDDIADPLLRAVEALRDAIPD